MANEYLQAITEASMSELPRLLRQQRVDAQRVQEAVLRDIVAAARGTEFGRAHGFADVQTVEDFRAAVPVSTWRDYADASERMQAGKEDVLFPGRASAFIGTSGTTGAPKCIPDSAVGETVKSEVVRLRTAEMIRCFPHLLTEDSKVFSISNTAAGRLTSGGIRMERGIRAGGRRLGRRVALASVGGADGAQHGLGADGLLDGALQPGAARRGGPCLQQRLSVCRGAAAYERSGRYVHPRHRDGLVLVRFFGSRRACRPVAANAVASPRAGKSPVRRMLADLGSSKRLLIACFAAIIVSKVLLAAAPMVAGSITDAIAVFVSSGSFDLGSLGGLCLLLAVLYFVGYGTTGFVNKGCVRVAEGLARTYRMRMQRKLNKLPISYLDRHPAGDIQARATDNVTTAASMLESTAVTLVEQFTLLAAVFVMMLVTDWRLTLIYVITLPLTMIITLGISKVAQREFKAQLAINGDLAALVSDTYANHQAVKAFSCEAVKKEQFDQINPK